jgi:beta-phosphoglucomutase-like phosphatase (HAD superfamily)
MDGTIINSIAAAERVWAAWAERHGLNVASFLPTIHGCVRSKRSPSFNCQASTHKPKFTRSC